MNKLVFLFIMVSISHLSIAQTTNTFPSNGNVGIGTLTPYEVLHLRKDQPVSTKLALQNTDPNGQQVMLFAGNTSQWNFGQANADKKFKISFDVNGNLNNNTVLVATTEGRIGIGTITPLNKLSIGSPHGDIHIGNSIYNGYNGIWLNGSSQISAYTLLANGNDPNLYINRKTGGSIRFRQDDLDQVVITEAGSVGIGTTDTKGYKLAVNGNAIFTSVKVKNYTTWPDYVFEQSYRLRPLSELEDFIRRNKHLPGIPAASEIESTGVDLGENLVAILKTTEELTLYLIEQNRQKDKLESQVIALSKELQELKKHLENK